MYIFGKYRFHFRGKFVFIFLKKIFLNTYHIQNFLEYLRHGKKESLLKFSRISNYFYCINKILDFTRYAQWFS